GRFGALERAQRGPNVVQRTGLVTMGSRATTPYPAIARLATAYAAEEYIGLRLAFKLRTAASDDRPPRRIRRPGGGRKQLTAPDASLLSDPQSLVEPTTRGDPQAPLLWTSRSLRNLAEALRAMGHRIGHNVFADLLRPI